MDLLTGVNVTKVFDFGYDLPSVSSFDPLCLTASFPLHRRRAHLKVRLYVRLSCHESCLKVSGMRVIPGELAVCEWSDNVGLTRTLIIQGSI